MTWLDTLEEFRATLRDDAEVLLEEWRAMLHDDARDELLEALRQPDVVERLARGGPQPPKLFDVGSLLGLADSFCALGLRRDELGTRALQIARACYLEIAKWPVPWPADALRSDVGQQLAQRTFPMRPTIDVVRQELASLERAMALPLADRPWALGQLHCAKLEHEWAYMVQTRSRPGREALAAIALGAVHDLPELGAVLAPALWQLQSGFVESMWYDEREREAAMRELMDIVPPPSWPPLIAFLREELARGCVPALGYAMSGSSLIQWTLKVAPAWAVDSSR